MADFDFQNNFSQHYGLSVLCNLPLKHMQRLVGASDAELSSWINGAAMVPRPVSRTLLLYAALCMTNYAGIDEIHRAVIDRPGDGGASDCVDSVRGLFVEAGLARLLEHADEVAAMLGVTESSVSPWLQGLSPAPGYLRAFMTAMAFLDDGLRGAITQAIAVVAPAGRGEGARDGEFRLAMAICDLRPYGLSKITGAPLTTVTEWAVGHVRAPRNIWTILSLYSASPLEVVEVLGERVREGTPKLTGGDGSLQEAIARGGFAISETGLSQLSSFLDVPVDDINAWLQDGLPAPPELWTLLMLLMNVPSVMRTRFLQAFIDPLAALTDGPAEEDTIRSFQRSHSSFRRTNGPLH
jgi:DNA-binding transcriptional regulator YdaS (Cro superfamily)